MRYSPRLMDLSFSLGRCGTPWRGIYFSAAGQVRPGLLLAESDGFEGADTLLTGPGTYSDLREFEIDDEGFVSRVRATSLIERTGRFELFHFAES